MLVMFGVFAVLFYKDGATGYRKKNESFYLNKTFQAASKRFEEMDKGGGLTPAEWRRFAEAQTVAFPEDKSVLPAGLQLPMPWPAILHDFDKMKPLQWNRLWRDYTLERGMDSKVAEEPYDAKKIREQWIVFVICALLAAVAAFFLIRTLGRAISVDDQAITNQQGKRVPFTDLKVLDLRKWETKGLAFIDYDGASGKGRIRIDGLTYGGFKKDHGEPAERLMQRIRKNFSGEIIEYAAVAPAESPTANDKSA
jgi:hypothetical protein